MSKSAILCVDDEPMVLTSLKEQIYNRLGNKFLYEFAESADEAEEVIEELAADGVHILVIVSDWLMPGVKGDEFLIRVHQRFPQIVKVMLTGQADEEAIRRVRENANLFRCIRKPWTEEELIETILSGLEPHNE
ncbi:response regulator [Thermodesulfobacteriota bacterium]